MARQSAVLAELVIMSVLLLRVSLLTTLLACMSDLPFPFCDSPIVGSPADLAGLKAGDFVLWVNGQTVLNATHSQVVSLIQMVSKE